MTATSTMPPSSDVGWFRERILQWARTHVRSFAWRERREPYAILIAEMMLHRTQARQVEPVYLRFLQSYPHPASLAQADEMQLAQILAPLGLAWRAANFLPLARTIMERHGGHVPCTREALLALPGVGPYVASAVLVFACDHVVALVDTNTVRVAGRYFGFPTHAESRRLRGVQQAISSLVDPAHPREANLALLDLAALICRPKLPLCEQCPVAVRCAYCRANRPDLSSADP